MDWLLETPKSEFETYFRFRSLLDVMPKRTFLSGNTLSGATNWVAPALIRFTYISFFFCSSFISCESELSLTVL